MEWYVKNLDNSRMRIKVILNSDISVDCIGQYRYNGEYHNIKTLHFKSFSFKQDTFTDVVKELVRYMIFYEEELNRLKDFFDNYKEFEFVR